MMTDIPTRLVDWRCDLAAIDQHRNVARSYHIHVSHDLFGHWIVDLHWGRLGTAGTGMRLSFQSDVAARTFVERTLARRASAPRRIGTPYVERKSA